MRIGESYASFVCHRSIEFGRHFKLTQHLFPMKDEITQGEAREKKGKAKGQVGSAQGKTKSQESSQEGQEGG